jgi:hypothetical protein
LVSVVVVANGGATSTEAVIVAIKERSGSYERVDRDASPTVVVVGIATGTGTTTAVILI